MGIKQLGKYLKTAAPDEMNRHRCANEYKGTTVAIDASPCLYQCLTAMGDTPVGAVPGSAEDTSHIAGLLRRTVRLLELGFKPIFVFDGDAPELKKAHVLVQREQSRARSREQLEEAKAAGDDDGVKRHVARLVKATPRHNDEAMQLLRLMGVPAVQAPGEAEALCAELATTGHAHAAATEDFDALVFGAPRLLRNLHRAAASPQIPLVQDIQLKSLLAALAFTQAEFVDFCILAGCDYLTTISKVGIVTARKLMQEHRSIEAILEKLDRKKYAVPEDWNYQAARSCFGSSSMKDVNIATLQESAVQAGPLRKLLIERYNLAQDLVDDCMRRLMAVKPPPLPPRPTVTRAPNRSGTAQRGANQRRPATPQGPGAKHALQTAFQQGKRKSLNEASPLKRRRVSAVMALKGLLGADIVLSDEMPIDQLECLRQQMEQDLSDVHTID